MNQPATLALIERFFGPEAARLTRESGFVAFLGAQPGSTGEAIASAVQQRLAELDAHPEGATPLAMQVRELLLSNAAELIAGATPDAAPSAPQPSVAAAAIESSTPSASPSSTASSHPAATSTSSPARPAPARTIVPTGLERDAAGLITRFGRASPQVMATLLAIARMRGLPDTAVEQTIANVMSMSAGSWGAPEGFAPASAPTSVTSQASDTTFARGAGGSPARSNPQDTSTKRQLNPLVALGPVVISIAGLALLLGVALVMLRFSLTSPTPGSRAPGQAAAPAAPGAGAGASPGSASSATPAGASPAAPGGSTLPSTPPIARAQPVDAARVVSELRLASGQLTTDRAAGVAALIAQIRAAEQSWTRYTPPARQAVLNAMIDAMFRLPPEVDAWPIVGEFGAGVSLGDTSQPALRADQVHAVGFAGGVLARLSGQRELPPNVSSAVRRRLVQLLGADRADVATTFAFGANAALRLVPARVLGGSSPALSEQVKEAIDQWAEAIVALHAADDSSPEAAAASLAAADATFLDTLGALVTGLGGTSPDPQTSTAIEVLAGRVAWRTDSPGPRKLVSWFDQASVPTLALHLICERIATTAGSGGTPDPSLRLPANASPETRGSLRDALVKFWNIPQLTTNDEARARLYAARTRALDLLANARGSLQHLGVASVLAELNLAAAFIDAGKPDDATQVLVEAERHTENAREAQDDATPVVPPAPVRPGEPWAVAYLTSPGAKARVSLVRELSAQATPGTLTRAEAELLAEAALGQSEEALRREAMRAVEALRASSTMVDALLRALPKAPRLEEIVRLIANVSGRPLPPASSEFWLHDARRALVEHQLELIARGSVTRSPDAIVVRLARVYAREAQLRADADTPPTELREDDAAIVLERAAQTLARRARRDARELFPSDRSIARPEEAERVYAARLAVATGPVQAFAVEQLSLVDTAAYAISTSRADRSAEAVRVLDSLARARNGAAHVFEQLAFAEAARLELRTLAWNTVATGGSP
jgi:hypothetical protein